MIRFSGYARRSNQYRSFGKDESNETQSLYQCFKGPSEGRDRAVQKYLHPGEAAHLAAGSQAEGDDLDPGQHGIHGFHHRGSGRWCGSWVR